MPKYLFLLLLLSSTTFAQKPDALSASIDKLMAEQFKANEPGGTAIVAKNGKIIYQKGFGMANLELGIPMKPDHVFRIGSITKQFTAVAILQLVEQGKLGLQDEITKFIPDYPTNGKKITIEHLLTHTSGIQSYTSMKDFESRMNMDLKPIEMIDHFKKEPMQFDPGTKWSYNNSGYFLLGYIIEKVSGKTYPQYIQDNIFKPVGMTHSVYGSDSKIIKQRAGGYTKNDSVFENSTTLSMSQPYAAGSIQSTVEDLFKWRQALNAGKLLKKENLEKAYVNYKLLDGSKTNYGYGWSFANVQGSATIEHGGEINGFNTMDIYLPAEDIFVAVFSNCDCISPNDVAAKIAATVIGKPYVQKEIPVDAQLLKEYPGVYENDKGEQRIITLADGKLYSQRGRNSKFLIKPWQKDKFFFENSLLSIAFSRNEKGAIEKLTTTNRNGDEVWKKVDKPVATLTEVQLDPKVFDAYIGEYEISPDFKLLFMRENGKMYTQATGQGKIELFALSETKFFLKAVDAQLEFFKDESGKVTKVVLKQNGRETEARKVK